MGVVAFIRIRSMGSRAQSRYVALRHVSAGHGLLSLSTTEPEGIHMGKNSPFCNNRGFTVGYRSGGCRRRPCPPPLQHH